MADDSTRDVYERRSEEWEQRRGPRLADARSFAASLTAGDRPVLDLGCGPGWTLPALPGPKIGLDITSAFTRRVRAHDPDAAVVQADIASVPFRTHSIGAVLADRSLIHLPRTEVPLALWGIHRVTRPGAPVFLRVFHGDDEFAPWPEDDFAGRRFSSWPLPLLHAVIEGAGFVEIEITEDHSDDHAISVRARRARALADTVGPNMRLLCVGLNPSIYAADVGVGFARPGNRFWAAAIAAGVVEADRDPLDALRSHGLGMTDLVKRATRRADELDPAEYRHGLERLELLCAWLRPQAVCLVGLAGWRVALDRNARPGWQARRIGGRPVYLMPSTSGLNAHERVETLTAHLRAAAGKPDLITEAQP